MSEGKINEYDLMVLDLIDASLAVDMDRASDILDTLAGCEEGRHALATGLVTFFEMSVPPGSLPTQALLVVRMMMEREIAR